jgi:two-component system alkaline phosphatase synthesis response regulator PhoP
VQPRCVLVVDDEEDIREVAALSFELAGWQVLVAPSGRDGIAAANAAAPDVVLLDVMMPELDGPGTYALLQAEARTRDIPVVFLTAKVQNADKRRYAALGVRGVIAKPFDPLTLPGEVEKILDQA